MSRRVRVLEVVRPSQGGMRKHVQGLVTSLDKGRFEVLLAAPEDEKSNQWAEMEGVRYIPLGISSRTPVPGDVIACLKLRKLIKTLQPDICHFHGFKAAAVGRVAVAICSLNTPLKFSWLFGASDTRRSAATVSRASLDATETTAADISIDNGSVISSAVVPKVVYTAHNSVLSRLNTRLSPVSPYSSHRAVVHFLELDGPFGPAVFQRHVYLSTEHALARYTHRVIAVSKAICSEYSAIPCLGPEKVTHIPNGIDLKRFCMITPSKSQQREKAKKDMGCATGIPVVGVVSRLIQHKGVRTFLSAVALLRQMGFTPQVLIAGDGPSRVELEAFSIVLGLGDHVRFLGFIDDMVSFYMALDVFVLSSFSEGMPLALIEAMAAGVPVVATRTGGVEEVVSLTKGGSERDILPDTGRLVTPGDSEAMALSIRDTLLFPQESGMLADRARIHVQENYSLEKMVRKTEEVYEEVLACQG